MFLLYYPFYINNPYIDWWNWVEPEPLKSNKRKEVDNYKYPKKTSSMISKSFYRKMIPCNRKEFYEKRQNNS